MNAASLTPWRFMSAIAARTWSAKAWPTGGATVQTERPSGTAGPRLGEISAAAARYVSAKTSDYRKLIAGQIASRSRDLDAIMERLRVGQGDSGGFSLAEPMAKRLKENLATLEKVISERTDLRDKLEARLAALHKVHGKIS